MAQANKKRLCANCRTTRDHSQLVREPPHLVHPISRTPGLYDVHGNAWCPDCGATWHRGFGGVKLVQ